MRISDWSSDVCSSDLPRTFDLAGCPPVNWTARLILIALVAFAAALGGTYAGRVLFAPERQSETELHALLHSELELDAAQEAKIEAIEQRFATKSGELRVGKGV